MIGPTTATSESSVKLRQRRGGVDLEIAHAGADDDHPYHHGDSKIIGSRRHRRSSNKMKTKKKKRRKLSICYHVVAYLRYGRDLLQTNCNIDTARVVSTIIKSIKNMTAIHYIVIGVVSVFVLLPLILFGFSERKVHHDVAIHYDIYNCPAKPVKDYPREYPILDVLKHWPTTNLTMPITAAVSKHGGDGNSPQKSRHHHIHKGICVFDLSKEYSERDEDTNLRQQVQTYQKSQVPFVIRQDPDVLETAKLWSPKSSYLSTRLSDVGLFPATLIDEKHKMPEGATTKGTATTNSTKTMMNWNEFVTIASAGSQAKKANSPIHQYASLRIDGCPTNSENGDSSNDYQCQGFVNNDLSFFSNAKQKQDGKRFGRSDDSPLLYDTTISNEDPIHCYYTSPGFLTETRLDDQGGIYHVVLDGSMRYILAHPRNCQTLYLKKEAESDETSTYHQSQIHLENYTATTSIANSHHTVQQTKSKTTTNYDHHRYNHPHHPSFKKHFPNFDKTTINEVILQPGDILYIPTHWVHHNTALETTYHCTASSKHSQKYQYMVNKCLKKYGVVDDVDEGEKTIKTKHNENSFEEGE